MITDNIETVEPVRMDKILAAREAIARGAMDTPDIFDASLDIMVDHAWRADELEQAREELMDAEFQRMTESDR